MVESAEGVALAAVAVCEGGAKAAATGALGGADVVASVATGLAVSPEFWDLICGLGAVKSGRAKK